MQRLSAVLLLVLIAGCGQSASTPTAHPTPTPTEEPTPSPTPTDEPTPEPTPEPTTEPVGVITFGVGLTDSGRVETEQDTFAPDALAAVSALLSEPAGATTLTAVISSVDAAGVETVVFSETMPIEIDPTIEGFGFEDFPLPGIVGNVPGEYVFRLHREATQLAQGTFTVTGP